MKIKSHFSGREFGIPKTLQKSFLLNDRSKSATIKVDFLGNYSLDVPYYVTEATARRSVFYRSAFDEITQQMINAYTKATDSLTEVGDRCSKIESDILYKKRLDNLSPQKYIRRSCPETKPSKQIIKKELQEEANSRFYSLFSNKTAAKKKYVDDNLDAVYSERLKHWEEVVTYFDYVESVIEAKENKRYYDAYVQEKTSLENKLFGPESYVRQGLTGIINDSNFPLSCVPFELEYRQKEGIIDIVLDLPIDLPLPREYAQLYASGKLWVKSKQGCDIVSERESFYLGLPFYVASKLFGLSLNIQTVRVSLVEVSACIGYIWIEFERENLRQTLLNYKFDKLSEALLCKHVFETDSRTGLKRIPITGFNNEIGRILNNSTAFVKKTAPGKKEDMVNISIEDAFLLARSITNNEQLKNSILFAQQSQSPYVSVNKSLASTLKEIKDSGVATPPPFNTTDNSLANNKFEEIDYVEYSVSERIEEHSSSFETEIAQFLKEVIDTEAPISKDILNRRICAAMGISRVSSRLSERISSILKRLGVKTTSEEKVFYWSDKVTPGSFNYYRKGGSRESFDISADEISNCIADNINCTGVTYRDSVLRDAANTFGFTRMGVNVLAAMESGVKRGVERGILIDNGSNILSTI